VSIRGIISDIRAFLLHRPEIPTLIEFESEAEREDYSERILQRIGMDVREYAVLNIHRIGIEAPVRLVFEELMDWDSDSTTWPHHLALVERIDGSIEQIDIFLLGQKKTLFGVWNGFLGLRFIPLFRMDALEIRDTPEPSDVDNARYLLYGCSGGYPIGIFVLYARSPIADRGEVEQTQLFSGVGFNFYGELNWGGPKIVNRVWERVHNRVTANVLARIKQQCESEFCRVRGEASASGAVSRDERKAP
jgi:hypothetical protein